jgi:hypothetical protein
MKITVAEKELNETTEIADTEAACALRFVINNFNKIDKTYENLDSIINERVYSYGAEGYDKDPNSRPIRKICFYIREY